MKTRLFILTIGSLLLLALLTVGVGFVPGHVAHAASACQTAPSDANCDGQSPDTTGCGADGTTLIVTNVGTGTVAVRYSPTCKSAWAHAVNGTVVSSQATITRQDARSYSSPFLQYTAAKSPMVYIGGHQKVQACGYINGISQCTNWVTY